VVAIGKHNELMENEPIYAEIYNSQILAYEAEHQSSKTSEAGEIQKESTTPYV
jgi:hypothetical protein